MAGDNRQGISLIMIFYRCYYLLIRRVVNFLELRRDILPLCLVKFFELHIGHQTLKYKETSSANSKISCDSLLDQACNI